MDTIWPSGIYPSSQTWRVIGNAGVFPSPLSGATRTVSRTGARMGCTVTVPPLKGQDRARFMAFIAALRDKSNRAYIPDFSTTQRGSFPATELLTNGDFSNGTTGWGVAGSPATLSVSDQIMRITRTSGSTNPQADPNNVSVTQYAPYALRGFFGQYRGSPTLNAYIQDSLGNSSASGTGLVTTSRVMLDTASAQLAFYDSAASGGIAGDYFDLQYASFARSIQADAGPNALTYSDQFDNAAWTKVGVTVTANAVAAPDGNTTADAIVENSSTSDHSISSASITVNASAADYCLVVCINAANRSWFELDIREGTGGTAVQGWFNCSTGAIGTTAVGANWSNARSFITNLGNSWYACCLVARKTNAATSISAQVYAATASGASSTFLGNGLTAGRLWRATLAQSSVPVRLTQTVASALASGTAQTGSGIYVKGLPASTSGVLKVGDPVERGGQINFLTASLDSDAAGLGYLQCGNPWKSSVADNDPIIVKTPMSKMILASEDMSIETGPGQFSPFQLEFVEDVT